MIKYNTFIFDLDGTLLDTLADLAASVNYALRAHQMPEHSIDDVRRFVGNGVKKLMERAVPEGIGNPLFDITFKTFQEHYLEHSLDTTHPYEGIPELLQELKCRGCRMAVVSNKMMKATQQLCHHFFPEIDVAIGENETMGIRRKPAPDTVNNALRLLNAEKEHAVYVGDSDVDIETAKNSELSCISVLWGFRDMEFLTHHGATHFVSKPMELLDYAGPRSKQESDTIQARE